MGLPTESKRGSDCSGTDGTANRVLTLANTSLTTDDGFMVFVGGLRLVPTTEYTVSHLSSSSTVTFLNVVYDSDYIVVSYIQSGTSSGTTTYCNYQEVYNKTGLSTTEIASAIVDSLILDAEAELESICGRKFTNANSITEYLSGRDKDLIGNYGTSFIVTHHPIQSITGLYLVDEDGAAVSTFDTLSTAEINAGTYENDDYWIEVWNDAISNAIKPNGYIKLKTVTIPEGKNNIKVSYTYGYATVPQMIKNLAVCLTGVRVWMTFIGGCYNRLDSYSIPQQSVNKGDFYARAQKNIDLLNEEANRLLDRIGRRQRVLFFASGADR